MKRLIFAGAVVSLAVATLAGQTVYPTGTTIYDPDRAWNGYTVLSPLAGNAVVVIDMNGAVVKRWDGFNNSAGGPARVMPDGSVIAPEGANPGHQESQGLVQRTFAGEIVWRHASRQHHDWQRENFPAGYYSPESVPPPTGGNTLILAHADRTQPNVADVLLEDDHLIEVSADGKVVWEWFASDHIDEMGFAADARQVIRAAAKGPARGAGPAAGRGAAPGAAPRAGGPAGAARGPAPGTPRGFDWLHVNSATYVGPNRWFDAGDQRFAPNHVIISSREASLMAIIARDGKVVWRMGPDFSASPELRRIQQIIGQHHAHLIPKGLPGAGNLLVFDNGGSSGYGFAGPLAPDGRGPFKRAGSRVLEINPVTLELVWSYQNARFFSTNISGAQRLPNGNTLITAGAGGRMFEVTAKNEIVWEYMYPVFGAGPNGTNGVYRSYRIPYDWMTQVARPAEKRVTPPALGDFRAPGN